MNAQVFEFGTAAVFLFLAVVGGGVSVKEITVPKIPKVARLALALLGIAAAVMAVLANPSDTDKSSPTNSATPPLAMTAQAFPPGSNQALPPCRHPVSVPSVADGAHTEADARQLLTQAGLFNVVSQPEFDPSAPKGLVVAITPSPGTVLCPREAVTIKVTR